MKHIAYFDLRILLTLVTYTLVCCFYMNTINVLYRNYTDENIFRGSSSTMKNFDLININT